MDDHELPPKVPADLPRLDRAIVLLGARAAAELRPGRRTELEQLIGTYPDAATARRWKSGLKKRRLDEAFDEEAAAKAS